MEKNWVKMSDVLFFQEGPGVRNTQYTTSGVKLLNVANLVDGKVDLSTSTRYISEDEAYGKYKHFLCDAGDFVVASSGIKVEYIDKKMGFIEEAMLPLCMNTSTIRFKVINGDKLRIKYFMYYLKSQHFKEQLAKEITGSAQLNYGPSHLKKMILPLIDVSAQDEIIRCLDNIQKNIDMRRKELICFDELIRARFVEMFGDMFLNTMGWQEESLESLADIVSGITKGRKIKEKKLIEVPYMAVSNVKNGYIDWTTVKTIEATEQEINQYRLLPDDVLMTEGGDPDKLGRGAIIREPLENCIHQNHIFRVRLNESIVLPDFFEEYLQHQRAKRYFLGCAKQTTGIASINMKQLSALPVLIPPLKLQQQFSDFVRELNKSKLQYHPHTHTCQPNTS
jgi:type I restriction enzyme, S subunit